MPIVKKIRKHRKKAGSHHPLHIHHQHYLAKHPNTKFKTVEHFASSKIGKKLMGGGQTSSSQRQITDEDIRYFSFCLQDGTIDQYKRILGVFQDPPDNTWNVIADIILDRIQMNSAETQRQLQKFIEEGGVERIYCDTILLECAIMNELRKPNGQLVSVDTLRPLIQLNEATKTAREEGLYRYLEN
jgi:alpha-glucosidase (family GH31 glycosyl hydrolase)